MHEQFGYLLWCYAVTQALVIAALWNFLLPFAARLDLLLSSRLCAEALSFVGLGESNPLAFRGQKANRDPWAAGRAGGAGMAVNLRALLVLGN